MSLTKILLMLTGYLFFTSCGCTDKYCTDRYENDVFIITCKGGRDALFTKSMRLYRTPKGNYDVLLDSVQLVLRPMNKEITQLEFNKASSPFFSQDHDYLLVQKELNFRDTITDFTFQIRSERKGCNHRAIGSGYCDYYNIFRYENISYRYNGRLVNGAILPDTLYLD